MYNDCIVLESTSDDDDVATPQFSEIKASLNRYRGKFYPQIPRSTREFLSVVIGRRRGQAVMGVTRYFFKK
jgi:hypothetical protein